MIAHNCSHLPTCFGCKVKTLQLQATPAFQPGYNWSVGKYISTDKEYRDELKRCAERNSIATGIDHNYEVRYPGETEPIREADGVLDETAKRLKDASV